MPGSVRWFAGMAVALTAMAVTPTPAPPTVLGIVLAEHLRSLAALHVRPSPTLEVRGTLDGLGLHGTFARWRDGERERYDQTLGVRSRQTLRVGSRQWVRNANGDVRELHGQTVRRQITDDAIESGDFARHPEDVTFLGRARLRDGRDVWQMRVELPGGEPVGIAVDATTFMIDEKAYVDGGAVTTIDYSDYRVTGGALYAWTSVESDGDPTDDIASRVVSLRAGEPIDPAVFAPLQGTVVDAADPVRVPILSDKGHYFVRAAADGQPLLLLIDTGSQGLFLDSAAAARLGLHPQGALEVNGSKRVAARGVAALDAISIGAAQLPARVVSVVDLSGITYEGVTADGVLGYPLFAAAEVRIDPDTMTMTIAKPGALAARGVPIALDTESELPTLVARVNGTTDGRFVADTGNSTDLLVYRVFVQRHPGVVFYGQAHLFAENSAVGGGSAAVTANVAQLQIGPFKLYNRRADVMLSDSGAFGDRDDDGNIGLGTLENFVFTFDEANRTLYLDKARGFDDGRFRPQYGTPQ